MARKRRFRFGLPIVFAGRPSVGGVGLGYQPIRFAAAATCGALGGVLPDSVLSDSKSPRRIFRRGLNSCDDEDMPVICPTLRRFFRCRVAASITCVAQWAAGPRILHGRWRR